MKKKPAQKRPRYMLFLIITTIIFLLLGAYLLFLKFGKATPAKQITYGVSYSPEYAEKLGFDSKKLFSKIVTELNFKQIRIPTYWDRVQPAENKYDFSEVDFMLEEAQKNGVEVLLVVGYKQPVWPECRAPKWAMEKPLTQKRESLLLYIEETVKRYKDHPAVFAWQVENEPLLLFGENCDPPSRDFLKKEVEIVRHLDSKKPIVITDSGELRGWVTPMQLSDIFGTTMYRSVYNPLVGTFNWPIPPIFYTLKSELVHKLFAPGNEKTIIVELQTEPWAQDALTLTPIDKQTSLFSVQKFKDNVEYAKGTGFDTIYLWGVEWWYYISERGHPEYLNYAKTL